MKQNFENSGNTSSNKLQSRRGFLKKMLMTAVGAFVAKETYENYSEIRSVYDFLREKFKSESIDKNPDSQYAFESSAENNESSEINQRFEKLMKRLIDEWPSPEKSLPNRESLEPYKFKKSHAKFSYTDEIQEPQIERTKLFENAGKFGLDSWSLRLIQTFRFQPITMAVERKYNLPRNLLLAMILQESSGEEYLPNAKDDGGFGLIHMQSGTARDFDVPVYKDCPAIVCDGKDKRSCEDHTGEKISHAKELRLLLEKNAGDRKKIAGLDGRLHHVENIDAAGRMISFHMARYKDTLKTLPDNLKKLGPLRAAVCKYSGPVNFPVYWERVRTFMALLSNESFLNELYRKMESQNGDGEINGKPLNFLTYIDEWQKFFAINYDLEEYVEGSCYANDYSSAVLSSYKGALPEIDDKVISRFIK